MEKNENVLLGDCIPSLISIFYFFPQKSFFLRNLEATSSWLLYNHASLIFFCETNCLSYFTKLTNEQAQPKLMYYSIMSVWMQFFLFERDKEFLNTWPRRIENYWFSFIFKLKGRLDLLFIFLDKRIQNIPRQKWRKKVVAFRRYKTKSSIVQL